MSNSELKYVNDVFDKNWIAPVGPHISKFEEILSKKHNNYSVAALNSGTSAIHLLVKQSIYQLKQEMICLTMSIRKLVITIG